MKIIKRLQETLDHIKYVVDLLWEKQNNISSIELIQHRLGSISLQDVRKEMSKVIPENERKEYVASVSSIYEKILKPKCEKFIAIQEEFMAREAENETQFLVGRGTINGLLLIMEDLKKDNDEHIENMRKDSENNLPKGKSPIGEIM